MTKTSSPLAVEYTCRTDVIEQRDGSQTILLNPVTGDVFGLQGVSLRIWELMKLYGDLEKVKTQIMSEFGVVEDQITSDLLAFVDQLKELDLILVKD